MPDLACEFACAAPTSISHVTLNIPNDIFHSAYLFGVVVSVPLTRLSNDVLKLINYSCSSYPTRACYFGQVDGLRNPMKNELKTRLCLKRFQTRIQIFLICILKKTLKTRGDKQLYLITHFMKQVLNLNYLLLTLNVTVQLLKNPQNRKGHGHGRSMVATSCFGSLSTLLYTSDLKWH